ncbi:type II toxin-antitoxin system RelE/ParE family toxin [Ulvibacterium sp.]|uniref:type II toxin-antitoxin system RelE/ParE family toxin n=1 Tax=Ulvibacterium sp. TaxID=2665914 RepID=UPI003CC696EA
MTYKIHISREAQIELSIAECFYKSKNLDREFLTDFSQQLQFLKAMPESFQVKYRNIRILNFERFNYSIHYIIKDSQILILRILNQKQNF